MMKEGEAALSNGQWLLRYAKRVKGWLGVTVLLLFLEMLANIGVVGIQKFIVDDLFVHRNSEWLAPLLAGLAVLAVAYNVLHLYAALARNKAEFGLQRLLLNDMLRELHRMSVSRFRKERTGKYVTNLTNDTEQTARLIGGRLPNGVVDIGEAAVLSVIIGVASPVLLTVMLAVSVIYVVLGRRMAPQIKQAGRAVADSNTEVIVAIEEGISSSREVIAFHRQQWEKRRFREKLSIHFNALLHQVSLINRQTLFTLSLQWAVRLAVLGYGGYLVFEGRMSVGWLVIMFQFSSQLMNACNKAYTFAIDLAGGMAVVERVRDVLEGEKDPDAGMRLLPPGTPVRKLTFEQVAFQYEADGSRVLDGIDLDLPIGRKIAFVGKSGCGKSTLVQLLIRFYEPDAGTIAVNGEALTSLSRDQWLKRVTVVFQEAYLFPDSIRNNLLLGSDTDEDRMKEICRKMQIHDYTESLPDGYDTQVGERGIQLSGGQRQRIALARALLADCDILILDEATSALDLETERQVMRHLDELRRGRTTIIIAHRLSTIADADMIFVLNDGRVAEWGRHDQLLASEGVYAGLVTADKETLSA